MIVSGAAPPMVDALRRVRRCMSRRVFRRFRHAHSRVPIVFGPFHYCAFCERAAPDAPEPIYDQRRCTGCRYRTIYGASRGARPYQDFAPSVNVLRRTRRNPSTIKGAAPVVVIGQSTAPRAGARPYQDFAPPCERAAPDAPEPIDDQRRRTGCRYRTIYGASRGSASLPRLCAFCERAAPDAPEPSKAGQNLGEVNGFEFFFLSREQTLQMDQTTRIDRDQKISIGFQC